jgi:hypothetical protein
MIDATLEIRRLNDSFRRSLSGGGKMAEFLSRERSRLAASLADADTLKSKVDELRKTVEDLEQLFAVHSEAKNLLHDRGVEISHLLRVYQPRAGRMGEERDLFQRVIEFVQPIEENLPPPMGDDLRTYAGQLIQFGEETRSGRLRIRLERALGLGPISRDIVLDLGDVAAIEMEFPNLSDSFMKACRKAVELNFPKGSDGILTWVKEAVRKQEILAHLQQFDLLSN